MADFKIRSNIVNLNPDINNIPLSNIKIEPNSPLANINTSSASIIKYSRLNRSFIHRHINFPLDTRACLKVIKQDVSNLVHQPKATMKYAMRSGWKPMLAGGIAGAPIGSLAMGIGAVGGFAAGAAVGAGVGYLNHIRKESNHAKATLVKEELSKAMAVSRVKGKSEISDKVLKELIRGKELQLDSLNLKNDNESLGIISTALQTRSHFKDSEKDLKSINLNGNKIDNEGFAKLLLVNNKGDGAELPDGFLFKLKNNGIDIKHNGNGEIDHGSGLSKALSDIDIDPQNLTYNEKLSNKSASGSVFSLKFSDGKTIHIKVDKEPEFSKIGKAPKERANAGDDSRRSSSDSGRADSVALDRNSSWVDTQANSFKTEAPKVEDQITETSHRNVEDNTNDGNAHNQNFQYNDQYQREYSSTTGRKTPEPYPMQMQMNRDPSLRKPVDSGRKNEQQKDQYGNNRYSTDGQRTFQQNFQGPRVQEV